MSGTPSLLRYVQNSSSDLHMAMADEEMIFKDTLNNANVMFSLFPTSGFNGSPLTIYGDGCAISVGGDINCTQVCSDPSLLFKTWQSQYSCLALAALSIGTTASFNISSSYIKATSRTASMVGVPDITGFDGARVLNLTWNCIRASCTVDDTFGDCHAENVVGYQAPSTEMGILTSLTTDIAELCATVPKNQLNTDIGGPGAIAAIYMFVISRLFTTSATIKWFRDTLSITNGTLSPRVTHFLSKVEESRIADATTNLLVEFQEAQVFFVLAIQIALLIATLRGAEFIDASSISSYLVDQQWIRQSAQFVLLPIVLNQLSLRRMCRSSVYSLLLCAVVLIMGAAVIYKTALSYQQDKLWGMFSSKFSVQECGYNTSLRAYCSGSSGFYLLPGPSVMPWIFVLYGVLVLEKVAIAVSGLKRYKLWYESPAVSKIMDTTRLGAAVVLPVFYFASEIALLVFIGKACYLISHMVTPGEDWNIGQLVAALIWAPVVAKYLYQILCGISKSLENRIPEKYAVVKRRSDQKTDEVDKSGPHDSQIQTKSTETSYTRLDANEPGEPSC
ncbi:uncharacterized protein FFMR_07274 [Fusarium fujikuroi]|nr:uncharacterized protein FFMR_07274 [Fusarium fujikuroi]